MNDKNTERVTEVIDVNGASDATGAPTMSTTAADNGSHRVVSGSSSYNTVADTSEFPRITSPVDEDARVGYAAYTGEPTSESGYTSSIPPMYSTDTNMDVWGPDGYVGAAKPGPYAEGYQYVENGKLSDAKAHGNRKNMIPSIIVSLVIIVLLALGVIWFANTMMNIGRAKAFAEYQSQQAITQTPSPSEQDSPEPYYQHGSNRDKTVTGSPNSSAAQGDSTTGDDYADSSTGSSNGSNSSADNNTSTVQQEATTATILGLKNQLVGETWADAQEILTQNGITSSDYTIANDGDKIVLDDSNWTVTDVSAGDSGDLQLPVITLQQITSTSEKIQQGVTQLGDGIGNLLGSIKDSYDSTTANQ